METRIDFLQWLAPDMSRNILMYLDDTSDLIRVSSVSHFWRHFVIENGLCKQLCVRMFPQLARVARIIEPSCSMKKSVDVGCSSSITWENLERDHRVYASLFQDLTAFTVSDCIEDAISASSTDHYPEESIVNTLDPRDIIRQRASYWSSKGHSDPEVPETLIYKLSADFCVISEIHIRPFQAFFLPGVPIYSAKSVRFRMGHPKSPSVLKSDLTDLPLEQHANDKFKWTYTSQEFPMVQENILQKFKLPEPILCIGGFLQIELLGRVHREEIDCLFYICVSHVQVLARSLFPAFEIEILESSGRFLLQYCAEAFSRTSRSLSNGSACAVSGVSRSTTSEERMWGHFGGLLEFLMHRNDPGDEPDEWLWDDEDNEGDPPVIL